MEDFFQKVSFENRKIWERLKIKEGKKLEKLYNILINNNDLSLVAKNINQEIIDNMSYDEVRKITSLAFGNWSIATIIWTIWSSDEAIIKLTNKEKTINITISSLGDHGDIVAHKTNGNAELEETQDEKMIRKYFEIIIWRK